MDNVGASLGNARNPLASDAIPPALQHSFWHPPSQKRLVSVSFEGAVTGALWTSAAQPGSASLCPLKNRPIPKYDTPPLCSCHPCHAICNDTLSFDMMSMSKGSIEDDSDSPLSVAIKLWASKPV